MRIERRFVCTDVKQNQNKFWNIIHDGLNITTVWGRVGETGNETPFGPFASEAAASKEFEKKIKQKLRKRGDQEPYREVDFVGEGEVAGQPADLKIVAASQIKTDCVETQRLIDYLVKVNVHQITSSTRITYSAESGLFKTPVGIVSKKTVDDARICLTQIGDAIALRIKNGRGIPLENYTTLVENYLMLIPMDLGRRKLNLKTIFPDLKAVQQQNAILDSLEASIAAVEQRPSKSSASDDLLSEKVFDCRIERVTDKAIQEEVERLYGSTKQARHESSHLRPVKVYTIVIAGMHEAFEPVAARLGNVNRYWHGTRASNLLSILRAGLIIPPKSASHCNGRLFGNGVYFSDQSTKSLNYAYGYWGGRSRDDNCFMLLADVAMGNMHRPRGRSGPFPKAGFDSTFAEGNVAGVYNNEMIVYDVRQINLVYLVEFGK